MQNILFLECLFVLGVANYFYRSNIEVKKVHLVGAECRANNMFATSLLVLWIH